MVTYYPLYFNSAEATEITSASSATTRGEILKHLLRFFPRDHCVVQSNVLVFVLDDPGVTEAGILITLEFVDRIIHERAVEQSQADKQLEILYGQARDLFE